VILLLQVAVILALSRALRWVFLPLRQPAVVAEMAAGLLVGPSCLGWLRPDWSGALFPAASLDALNALSQIGLVTFMFIVGTRIGSHAVGVRRQAAVLSAVSIVVPLALGAALAWTLHDRLAPQGVGTLPFTLLVGAAMSITAFPVLARILSERNMLASRLGTVAIACGMFFFSFLPVRARFPFPLAGFSGTAAAAVASAILFPQVLSFQFSVFSSELMTDH